MKVCLRSNLYLQKDFPKPGTCKTTLSISSKRQIAQRHFVSASREFWSLVKERAKTHGTSPSDLNFNRKFFDDFGKQMGVKTLNDWYNIVPTNKSGSAAELQKDALLNGLMTSYPEHNWIPWKFNVPFSFWDTKANQEKYFDWLGKEIGVKELDDWYQKLSSKVLIENGGQRLIGLYNGSPTAALMAAYPEHNWIPWKFNWAPMNFWLDGDNKRKFFDSLGKEIGIQKLDDWYQKMTRRVVIEHGGVGILTNHYNNSGVAALMAAYPEHNWIPWKFNILPHGFWKDPTNQRSYFDYLGKQIGVKTLDDWYSRLSKKLCEENGGTALLSMYQGSAIRAIIGAYPEHNWSPWKFETLPKRFWNSDENIRRFLAELSEKLSIQTLDDWYRVDLIQLQKLGAASLVQKYRGLYNLLKEQYPHHPWNPKRFKQVGKKGQRWLAVTLKKIFPNEGLDQIHP